jgi:hypothetical protein
VSKILLNIDNLSGMGNVIIPLPLEGERPGEGVKYQALTPSP